VIAALAAAALIVSAGFAVNRIVGDPSTVAVQTPNIVPPAAAVASAPALTAADVCGGEFGWVCAAADLSGGVTAADVCGGGLGWACVFTPQY
jgi:hypothetical protein